MSLTLSVLRQHTQGLGESNRSAIKTRQLVRLCNQNFSVYPWWKRLCSSSRSCSSISPVTQLLGLNLLAIFTVTWHAKEDIHLQPDLSFIAVELMKNILHLHGSLQHKKEIEESQYFLPFTQYYSRKQTLASILLSKN